jgi:acyl carrier protein
LRTLSFLDRRAPLRVSRINKGAVTIEVENVKCRIKEIIESATHLAPANIDERANLNKDLKIDSLTLLEVALTIDQEFGTDFTDEELLAMESIQKAAEMVVDRLSRGT